MTREIRHSFFIDAPMDAILAALVTEEHIRNSRTKEARVKQYVETGKGIPYHEMQDTSATSGRA